MLQIPAKAPTTGSRASFRSAILPRLAAARGPRRAFSASASPRASVSPELAFPTKAKPTPFEIFHLDPRAPIDPKALKRRFYELSRVYHPDLRQAVPSDTSSSGKGKAKEEDGSSEFRQIVEAYEILRDERKRGVYLRSGRAGPSSARGWNDPGYNFSRGRPMSRGFDRGAYPSASWDWAGDPYNPHFRAGAHPNPNPSAPGWSSSGTLAKNSTVFLILLTASALLSPLTFWSTMPESMLVASDTGSDRAAIVWRCDLTERPIWARPPHADDEMSQLAPVSLWANAHPPPIEGGMSISAGARPGTDLASSQGRRYLLSLSPDGAALRFNPLGGELDRPDVPLASVAFIKRSEDESLVLVYIAQGDSPGELPRVEQVRVSVPAGSDLLSQPTLAPLVLSAGQRHLSLIINDHAGARQAIRFSRAVLEPLLQAAGVDHSLSLTRAEKDAGEIARRLVGEGKRTFLLAGGDGTVGEVVDGLLVQGGEARKVPEGVELVLVPMGTANALYHHSFPPESLPSESTLAALHSLLAFLRRTSTPSPLPLALNSFTSPNSSSTSSVPPVITTVVSSAALHAALLHDAEALRSSHPGVERFKIAAQANVTSWWDGTLVLTGKASRYDAEKKELVELGEEDKVFKGPVAYVVSALVSRFESTFVVAPHRSPLSSLAPKSPSVDSVLIRPLRNKIISRKWEEAKGDEVKQWAVREEFVARVWEVTGGMYGGGKHVDLKYAEDEGGEVVVEYLRSEGFEWTPAPSDEIKSNLFCLDGALVDLERGGSAKVQALGGEFGVSIWA